MTSYVLIQLEICEFLLIICEIIWRSAHPCPPPLTIIFHITNLHITNQGGQSKDSIRYFRIGIFW